MLDAFYFGNIAMLSLRPVLYNIRPEMMQETSFLSNVFVHEIGHALGMSRYFRHLLLYGTSQLLRNWREVELNDFPPPNDPAGDI